MPPSLDPKAYWVGFNLARGIGAVRLKALLEKFGSIEAAWKAPEDALIFAGLPQKALQNLLRIRAQTNLEEIWNKLQQKGIQVFTWEDDDYPRRLLQIDQPPPVLYVHGSLIPEDEVGVAVVGTRRLSPYGQQVAGELATFLAANRITVVSGLARGIDRAAHEAALKAGGRTLAVLGSGVDVIYPPEHANLAKRMIEQGGLISDYAPGTPPDGINFPPRNRIISGLSMAVVVVEADEKSGALITANFAAAQGREVFAVPGGIYAPQSRGPNRLIRDGAIPLLRYEEILEVLQLGKAKAKQQARSLLRTDDATELNLLKVMADEPRHVDEICAQSGLPIEQVSATLTLMELKGLVRQVGGMNFSLVRENLADYRTNDNA